jgi:hypothetical protein
MTRRKSAIPKIPMGLPEVFVVIEYADLIRTLAENAISLVPIAPARQAHRLLTAFIAALRAKCEVWEPIVEFAKSGSFRGSDIHTSNGINRDSLSEDLRIISHDPEWMQCSAERRSVIVSTTGRVAEVTKGH